MRTMGLQMYYKIMKSANVFVRKCTIYTKYDYLCSPKTTNNMAVHNELGTWGEEVAAQYLTKKGYTIVERDWKSGHRDIDIIALKDDIVVFVEVKTRRNNYFGEPEDAVDFMKLRNLRTAINHYIKYKNIGQEIRFDVISVIGTPEEGTPEINHFEDIPMY